MVEGARPRNVVLVEPDDLAKVAGETQDKIASAGRDLAAARAEIVALKAMVAKLDSELAQLKAKAPPAGTK